MPRWQLEAFRTLEDDLVYAARRVITASNTALPAALKSKEQWYSLLQPLLHKEFEPVWRVCAKHARDAEDSAHDSVLAVLRVMPIRLEALIKEAGLHSDHELDTQQLMAVVEEQRRVIAEQQHHIEALSTDLEAVRSSASEEGKVSGMLRMLRCEPW